MSYRSSSHKNNRKSPRLGGAIAMYVVAGLIWAGLIWWWHVPLNPNLVLFWCEFLGIFLTVAWPACFVVAGVKGRYAYDYWMDLWMGDPDGKVRPLLRYACAVIVALVATGLVIGSPLLSSSAYAHRLSVEQSSFDEWSDKLKVDGISLMDTDSATMVGNRELGSLQDVVSQFDDARYYQIILDGTPQKVAPLQYVSFFSWMNNRGIGAPGYVLVDPIRQNADYHKLESIEGIGDGLRFVPSAYFNNNLQRLLWMQYPTKSLGDPHFELDDEGHPFYVTQSFGYAAPFGAKYVEGVVVTDPVDGSSSYYDVDSVPAWLDVVYDGDLLDEMYDDYGCYSGGFWNSLLGQVGCTRTGGDYGYVMIGDEQWIYTGVTSMGSDSSNIGFLLASERTGEAYFLPMASADESSAMSSAEGKVQQYGYRASFPSLVSIDGQPTYVMVLKDSGGLIRLYAMVNAESYNVVACEPDLVACKASYEKAMRAAGIEFDDDEQEMPEVDATGAGVATDAGSGTDAPKRATATGDAEGFEVKVAMTQMADEGGDTYLYVLDEEGEVWRIAFADDPKACMTLGKGDTLAGTAVASGDVHEVVTVNE